MIPDYIDVAVIGGGPAGMAAALAAAEGGASVVLLERKREWGRPVQCGGFAPRIIGRHLSFDARAVRARVENLALHFNGELVKSVLAPGYILDRAAFESQLSEAAFKAGVLCLQPAQALEVSLDGRVRFKIGMRMHQLGAEVVIGADGPHSLARRALGLPPQLEAFGLEYEMPVAHPSDRAEIYFREEYGSGYAWIFPHGGNLAGVGLAIDVNTSIDRFVAEGEDDDNGGGDAERIAMHSHLLARRALVRGVEHLLQSFVGEMIERGALLNQPPEVALGGPIPVGGPAPVCVRDRILLAGDAAGQTNPLTGAGIFNAVLCGELAGKAAARAVRSDDYSALGQYEQDWRGILGDMLGRALRDHDALATSSGEDYMAALRRGWHLKQAREEAAS